MAKEPTDSDFEEAEKYLDAIVTAAESLAREAGRLADSMEKLNKYIEKEMEEQ
tara:strand:- start:511 stop:669 length:159 start_codon:yes stop_codon:yes gene_type:complete